MRFEFGLEVETKNAGPVQDMERAEVAAIVLEQLENALEEYITVRLPWIIRADIT